MQVPGELDERDRPVLPEREHGEVLRVGESEGREQGLVERDEAAGGCRHGQAHLRLDGQRVGHATTLS